MEQARILLAIVLSFLVFFVWETFFVNSNAVHKKNEPVHKEALVSTKTKAPVIPVKPKETASTAPLAPIASAKIPTAPARVITVDTDDYRVQIDERGGVFKSFKLKHYKETIDPKSPLYNVINTQGEALPLQTAFVENGVAGMADGVYEANVSSDDIHIKQPQTIKLVWQNPNGVRVIKQFHFLPNSYLIDYDITVENRSSQMIKDRLYVSLFNKKAEKTARYGFSGPSAYIDSKLKQIKYKDIAKDDHYEGNIQWMAVQNQYFMSCFLPENVKKGDMLLHFNDHLLQSSFRFPEFAIAAGTARTYKSQLFFGPKKISLLKHLGKNLDRAVNFGFFDILSRPCLWVMNQFYKAIPNYGLAIIFLTILTKVLLWPLGNKSYKSMNQMKRMQPIMAELREKYKGDKKRINEEMMNLYRTYKINPMGGCLPMVLQIPVFFALYEMLYEAIELRHAPFFGWITDLSAPDRLFHFPFHIPFMEPPTGIPVLTIIMGATMFLQQKMSPPPGDPTQAKMMLFMPIIFTVIFINFSSGLVLYWLVNNILSIAQQYYVQKKYA